MATYPLGQAVLALMVAGAALAVPDRAQAFWQRSQVSMCADAASAREYARHRCDELNGFADPGWPALGLRGGAHRYAPQPMPGFRGLPDNRAPVRRLG